MTRELCRTGLAACLAAFGLLALAAGPARAYPPALLSIAQDTQQNPPAAPAPAPAEDTHPDACWRDNNIGLSVHPIAFTLTRPGVRILDTVIAMHPIGYFATGYSHYPVASYALGHKTEVAVGITTATFTHSSREPVFYGAGIQKQLLGDPCRVPTKWSLAVGGYGYTGNGYSGGAGYVVGSGLLAGTVDKSGALYGHAGLEVETFSNGTSDTGVRPFLGASWIVLRHKLTLNAEVAIKQSWEAGEPFAVKAAIPIWRGYGVSFGIRNNGFHTEFVGPL